MHPPHTHTGATFLSTNRRATLRTNRNQQKRTACDITTTVGQTPPRKVARNSIGRSFNKVRKRCNSNDLNSMFERVAGELRAKLGVDSAMRQARCGRDTCAVAGPGRASRQRTRPHPAAQTPPVWRAPEGPAAVPVGGGGAWPGFEPTRQATRQRTRRRRCGGRRRDRRARAGFEIDHSERSSRVAISRAAGPSGARNTSGAAINAARQAGISRIYSPARRSTSCMMRPHTALTHATAATPRTRERQGRTCRKSSKP